APIAVCIGSDDPLTFATNLRQEYSILYEALITGGVSDCQAQTWLERARDTGLHSRFTIPFPGGIDSETDEMTGNLKNLFAYHAFGLDEHVRMMP
ncbi:MAG: hypothetical protein GY859_22870, partial [Desulfobacterales bacterium]|nr:hypothetical protein [Desulfobacterales bacterium]